MPLDKYYCEYCEKTFNDTPHMRKKHNESRYHKMMVKLHYDSFRELTLATDPAELLAEEGGKPPCQTFMTTGQCSFGTACRYSHLPQFYPFKEKLVDSAPVLRRKVEVTITTQSGVKRVLQVAELPPSLQPPFEGGYNMSLYPPVNWG